MIDSVIKYHKPQMNADERRFFVPSISSSPVLIDPNQKNNPFFAPFAYFAVKNSANHSKPAPQSPPNIFDEILKARIE